MVTSSPSPIPAASALAARRREWAIIAGALAIGLAAFGIIFRPEIAAAITVWMNSDAYSHCVLVLPVALYLAWDRRDMALATALRPAPALALLALPVMAAWFAAERLGIMEARQLAAMTLLQVMIAALLGWRMWRALAAPLLYLYFLVPFGEFLIPPLQNLAVHFTKIGLDLLGIPNFVDGITIEIPEGTFLVHQACSGMRFLIASLAFSVFFACLIYTSALRRALFIAAAFVVAVIANDLRVFGIVLIAHFIGNVEAVETGHVLWGWLFYVIVGAVLVLMGLGFRQERRPPAAALLTGAGSAKLAAVPLAIVVVLASAPRLMADYMDKPSPGAAASGPITAPNLAGCSIVPPPPGAARGASGAAGEPASPVLAYRCDDKLFVVSFRRFPPRTGVRPLFSFLRLAETEGGGDIIRELQGIRPRGADAPMWRITETQEGPRYVAVATTLWLDGRPAGTGIAARVTQALNTFRRSARPPVTAVVSYSEVDDANTVLRRLQGFLGKTAPFSHSVSKLLSAP